MFADLTKHFFNIHKYQIFDIARYVQTALNLFDSVNELKFDFVEKETSLQLVLTQCYFFCASGITSQRKYSRHVPVAAEVKTRVNFDCPEEFGYYPHPNDCTQYYVCVFGGALLESCTGGLMYR